MIKSTAVSDDINLLHLLVFFPARVRGLVVLDIAVSPVSTKTVNIYFAELHVHSSNIQVKP